MNNKSPKFVNGTDINKKPVRLAVKDLVYRPSVYGVCIKKDKVLLSRCWDGYDFPGGGMEMWETLQEALVREFFEESGLKITPGKILYINDGFFVMPDTNNKVHSIQIYFEGKNPKGKISDKYFDHYEKINNKPAEWVNIKDINKLKFYNGIDSVGLIKNTYKNL